jgi:hypothetical protein
MFNGVVAVVDGVEWVDLSANVGSTRSWMWIFSGTAFIIPTLGKMVEIYWPYENISYTGFAKTGSECGGGDANAG